MPSAEGPDGPGSWAIVAACCFINSMLFGMTRLNGVLFVASVPRYGVGREEASFPYTFANFVRNTAGPLVGYLGHKLGVRMVSTFGCLLAAIGVGTCFLAESVGAITVLWGVLYGLGFGFGSILLPVKINQYFDKHRATASGLSFSGSCIGSFVLPSIVEVLVDTYGLSGTFLILAGLVLNCVPAALLLRTPNFTIKPKQQQNHQDLEDETQRITSGRKVKLYTLENGSDLQIKAATDPIKRKFGNLSSKIPLSCNQRMKCPSMQTLLSRYSFRMSSPDLPDIETISRKSREPCQGDHTFPHCGISSVGYQKSDQDSDFSKNGNSLSEESNSKIDKNPFVWKSSSESSESLSCKNSSSQYLNPDSNSSKNFRSKYFDDHYIKNNFEPDIESDSLDKTTPPTQQCSARSSIFSIIYDLITITNALYSFTFVCMMAVIVDFAIDIGVGETNEKYVLMSLSAGDLIGRLGLGWLTDGGHMTRSGFAALCFLCQGVMTTAIAWSSGFFSLVVLAALYGVSEAGLIIIFPLIVAEFVDEDKQTVAIPSASFLAGPLCLLVAPLIGYFRDEIGSYKYIFYGIGLISGLCSFAWLLTTCIVKFKKSKKRSRD